MIMKIHFESQSNVDLILDVSIIFFTNIQVEVVLWVMNSPSVSLVNSIFIRSTTKSDYISRNTAQEYGQMMFVGHSFIQLWFTLRTNNGCYDWRQKE